MYDEAGDLFPPARRRGKLFFFDCDSTLSSIEGIDEMARARGWKRVYWHTPADNAPARRVYDRFAPADAVVRYTLEP